MPITLFFLQASRSIRTAWLLESLKLEYDIVFAPRENNKSPQWLKDQAGGLGKFLAIKDGQTSIYESGNITEYLCDKHDTEHRILPPLGDEQRYAILQWVHAAEATFLLHGLAILYNRWNQKTGDVAETEAGLSGNVSVDLAYIQRELERSGAKFLFGDKPCAADYMMEFSIDFILTRGLGAKKEAWPRLVQYLKDCHSTPSWKRAKEKSGYEL